MIRQMIGVYISSLKCRQDGKLEESWFILSFPLRSGGNVDVEGGAVLKMIDGHSEQERKFEKTM